MTLNWQTEYHRYQRYFVNIDHLALSKKSRVYTSLILSLFAIAFFLFFAIKPTVVTITTLNKEIADKKIVAQKLEQKNLSLSQAQKEYLSVEQDLPLVDEGLPKSINTQTAIKQIEALASLTGVKLGSAKYGESLIKGKIPSSLTNLSIDTTISGQYEDLKSFLQGVLTLRRVSSINQFSFQEAKKQTDNELTDPLDLVLSLEAQVYSLGEDQ